MSNWRELGICPNAHGPLTILKKPFPLLHFLSEDLLDVGELMGTDGPEGMFGYLLAICPECSFVVTSTPTHEYNYGTGKWEIPETEEEDESQSSGEKTT